MRKDARPRRRVGLRASRRIRNAVAPSARESGNSPQPSLVRGLRVGEERLSRCAAGGNLLQLARLAPAASCYELRVTDASPYSHSDSPLIRFSR
jgi:hypothetical protein